jgi:hypothetical protein
MQSVDTGDGNAGTGDRHNDIPVSDGGGGTHDDRLDGDGNIPRDSRDENGSDIGDGNAGTGDTHDDMPVGDGSGGTDAYELVGDGDFQRDLRDDNVSNDNIVHIAGHTTHQYAQLPENGDLHADADDDHLLLFIWMWTYLHRKILQIQLHQTSNLLLTLLKRKRDGNRTLNRAYGLEWMDSLLPSEFKRGVFTISFA